MKLNEILDIKENAIISIVGAGGKTTFMYSLAQEFRNDNKCLVTTTTKIYVPKKGQFDYMAIGAQEFNKFKYNSNNGIYVYGSTINDENKLIGINPQELLYNISHFQYVLIEADGSKRKQIKGWNNYEPVICTATTNTIGILSIEAIGKEINEDNVHRVKEFKKITNTRSNEIISENDIISLIFHPEGLFKGSKGEKILFVNKVESNRQWIIAEKLIECIINKNKGFLLLDKIIIGSLLEKKYIKYSCLNK